MNDSEFHKIDFHIHTPKSLCYSDKSVTFQQIVEAALASMLDAIAITDHNSVSAVDEVRRLAAKDGLIIFPGIELTTRSGHFLALFEIDTPTEKLNKLLDEIGVTDKQRGDGGEVIDYETLGVFEKVTEYGGLVIAAHIERWPSGFLESKESRVTKMAIHSSPYLSALEITVAQNREQWENGLTRGYPRKFACVQGSDAHSPNEIGRRSTFIRMDVVNLNSLRAVFQNWQGNIAFSRDEVG